MSVYPADPAAASARRGASDSIREVRERLRRMPAAEPEFEQELLLMFVRAELAGSIGMPMLALVIAGGLLTWAPPAFIMIWLGAVVAGKLLRLLLYRRLDKQARQESLDDRWRIWLTLIELFYGAMWASIVFVPLNGNLHAAFSFLFASMVVVITVRMMFASTVLPMVYAGTAPITLALIARFATQSEPFYWAMAAVAAGLQLYLIFLVKGLNFNVRDMLKYRAEKDALIAELEQANAYSDEARRRAEAASMAKSRFLATMSHELRTPLNAILGFSEIMKEEILGPLENLTYKAYARDINESGQHLLNLINEILDLSRIEAGRYELHEEPIVLKDIAEECERLLRIRAESKAIRIAETFTPNLPRLWADERAVRQVCLNLLSNAIKFTPPEGEVVIRVGVNARGEQFLSIKDNGPGIAEDEIPAVMSSFGQGAAAHDAGEGGSGLGLPIVKGLMDLHGGGFELKSKLRQGTETIVTFPRERIMLPTARGAARGTGPGPRPPAGPASSDRAAAAENQTLSNQTPGAPTAGNQTPSKLNTPVVSGATALSRPRVGG
jgi:two-component system cell cycle sensor histidine kinase PleC